MTGYFISIIPIFSSSFESLSPAGSINGEWEGALTGRRIALAPFSLARSTALVTAPAWPDITIWPGQLKLAGTTTSPFEASLQSSSTLSFSIPKIAAIPPVPAGTASSIYLPLAFTRQTASLKLKTSAATRAVYSPRECPARSEGFKGVSEEMTLIAAMLAVNIAGWVLYVSFRSASGPLKQREPIFRPRASSASSKVSFATLKLSKKVFPIPTY